MATAAELSRLRRVPLLSVQLSMLQTEFAPTQALDRPLTPCSSEEVLPENLDIGRPDEMQLFFNRVRDAADGGRVQYPRLARASCRRSRSSTNPRSSSPLISLTARRK